MCIIFAENADQDLSVIYTHQTMGKVTFATMFDLLMAFMEIPQSTQMVTAFSNNSHL